MRFHSTGETFIRNQLRRNHIPFKEQMPIKVRGDKKRYRVADFYLPKKKLYIEFLGKWDNLKQQYINKINVYKKNKVKVLYVYPTAKSKMRFKERVRRLR